MSGLRIKTHDLTRRRAFWSRLAFFHAWAHAVFVVHGGTHGFQAKYSGSHVVKTIGSPVPGSADKFSKVLHIVTFIVTFI